MSNTTASYLKYAHVQMAAEAFLIDPDTNAIVIDDRYRQALIAGNGFNSKFPVSLAAEFRANWEVVAHAPNSESGFSGTLFKGREGGQYAGELVLSFRSTEFIGDAMRDSFVTNRGIKKYGWAFGQIADMRAWLEEDPEIQAALGHEGCTIVLCHSVN